MDTTTTLLTLFVLTLCALPIVIAKRSKAKKERELKETILKLAGNSNTQIDQFDRWNNKAVAIDNLNNKVFFISGKANAHRLIDLSTIQQASLIKTHHNGGAESSAIKKVDLYLLPKERGKPNIELEFYDADHDSLTIRDELQLAEKWSKILESAILKLKETKY
jgi:hypothetical protein